MTARRDFAAGLARSRKNFKENARNSCACLWRPGTEREIELQHHLGMSRLENPLEISRGSI